MMGIRLIITKPHESRVETGPLQFNGDWPGVFIRGDEAFALANALSRLPDFGNEPEDDTVVRELVRLLRSCKVER